jgi:hypothetical protein
MTGRDHLSAAAGAGERGGGLVAVLGCLGHHTALAAAGPLRAAAGPLWATARLAAGPTNFNKNQNLQN